MTTRPIVKGIRQVGLYAPDPTALAEFYQVVLGLKIIGMSRLNTDKVPHSIFLGTRSTAEHHHLEIFANPEPQHTAFEVETLADLRTFYQHVVERNLPIQWSLNHGVSLAFYFTDPAGNLIKLYWPTGEAYPQPHGHPIDLTQPEAALYQDVSDLVAQLKYRKEVE